MGRNLKHLLSLVENIKKEGIDFKSLQEGFDTTTAGGSLIFHIFGALAEFERILIVERTKAGLESARARGRFGGRPEKLSKKQIIMLKTMYNDKKIMIKDLCEHFNVSKPTLYNYLKVKKESDMGSLYNFDVKPEWPEEYKGYKVKDLMKTLEEIATRPGGTEADEKQIDVMDDFLKEYKYGIYADEI